MQGSQKRAGMGTKDIVLEHFGRITSSPLRYLSFPSHAMGGRHGLGSILLGSGESDSGGTLTKQFELHTLYYVTEVKNKGPVLPGRHTFPPSHTHLGQSS